MRNFVGLTSTTLKQYQSFPLLLEALEAEPGFNEAVAVFEETGSMLQELRAKTAQADPGFDNDTILEYGEIPPSWLDSVGASRIEQEALNLQIQAVESLRSKADWKLDSIATGSTDSLLATLGQKMQKVVADIRSAVDGLDGASTPLEAIEKGTADSWQKLTESRKEYNRLCSAQQAVMVHSASDAWTRAKAWYTSDKRNSFAVIRNLHEVFPLFAYETKVPWPHEMDDFLVWCIRNGADLWLPTVAELTAERDERGKNFQEEIDRLVAVAKAHRTKAIEELNSGDVHPHVQRVVRDRDVL